MYFYVSGLDLALNKKLDALFENWDADLAQELFNRYVCGCNENENQELRKELAMTVAQILGSLIEMAGQAALSNDKLETHMEHLAKTNEPRQILRIASDIISDTRTLLDQSQKFEMNLSESTQEISSLKDELDQVRRMATTDSLTGLYNRRGFDEEIEQVIKRCNEQKHIFSLLIIDIDHFKRVNDNHGHLVGDKVLRGISKLLHKQMRGKDYLSRFGGEEFAVILRDTPITGAFTVAENLRRVVEKLRLKHVKTGKQLEKVTISIGVASYRYNESIKDFIQRCDKALYRAKVLGRNRTVLAD
jgi:diguanylate cyclase